MSLAHRAGGTGNSERVLAIVSPGQGAQTAGFLRPWTEVTGVEDHLARLGEGAALDLLAAGTTWDEDAIRDTAVAQPLLVGAALATATVLFDDGLAPAGTLVAGHSVGELAAAALAGVLPESDVMGLVGVRGRAMAKAAARTPTGMAAVLGGDAQEVADRLSALDLTAANVNGAGQVVAAGALTGLEALAASPPAKARVIPLKVAGAFHTAAMRPAVDALRERAVALTPGDPVPVLLTNADGSAVTAGGEFLDRLVNQVSNPVRWDLCMETMLQRGVTGLLELCPGGTLTGLARRGMKGVETLALKTPDDLDEARAFVAAHTTVGGAA